MSNADHSQSPLTWESAPAWAPLEAIIESSIALGATDRDFELLFQLLKSGTISAEADHFEIRLTPSRQYSTLGVEHFPAKKKPIERGWWNSSNGLILPLQGIYASLERCPYSAQEAFFALIKELRGESTFLVYDPANGVQEFFGSAFNSEGGEGNDFFLSRGEGEFPRKRLNLSQHFGSPQTDLRYGRYVAVNIELETSSARRWAAGWNDEIALELRRDTARPNAEELQAALDTLKEFINQNTDPKPKAAPAREAVLKALSAIYTGTPPSTCTKDVKQKVRVWIAEPENGCSVTEVGTRTIEMAFSDWQQQLAK